MSFNHSNLSELLHRYYLNGVDAFRLKLLLPLTQQHQDEIAAEELNQMSLSNGAPGSSPSSDVSNRQDQPQNQEKHNERQQAGSGTGNQESQSEQANNLLKRLSALRT